MKDYHELQLNCDVLLLAEVFNNFGIVKTIWIISKSLSERTRFKLAYNAQYNKS